MTARTPATEVPLAAASPMARWRCWLFNRLARWEEASIAKSFGLPVDRVVVVDVSEDGEG